jgi:hypothetical protein
LTTKIKGNHYLEEEVTRRAAAARKKKQKLPWISTPAVLSLQISFCLCVVPPQIPTYLRVMPLLFLKWLASIPSSPPPSHCYFQVEATNEERWKRDRRVAEQHKVGNKEKKLAVQGGTAIGREIVIKNQPRSPKLAIGVGSAL